MKKKTLSHSRPSTEIRANDPLPNAQRNWTALLLALMMFLAPSLGVPSEEILQDTLKSAIVAILTLSAFFTFFWFQRGHNATVAWHPMLWLPIGLTIYGLGSMAWSHTYLGGVEAFRWFIFSAIVWLGINAAGKDQLPRLTIGIHLGATVAALWCMLQFWFDFRYFPQGPNPASTFVNRNFLAEFLVSAMPFAVYLLVNEKRRKYVFALTVSLSLNLTSILMTGTRSALLGLLLLCVILPVVLFVFRDHLASKAWDIGVRVSVPLVLVLTVLGLGLIPTHNQQLISEFGGGNAIDRSFARTMSMTNATEYTEGSFSIRAAMWKATWRMIEAHPIAGVGAGAWEVQAPLYQTRGTQLETDFYAHNEFLQLLAEYGFAGWVFLTGLVAYLLFATWRTWKCRNLADWSDGPIRAFTLTCVLVFMLVSNAGFPWRLAVTGALFALALGILGASDARMGQPMIGARWSARWPKERTVWILSLSALLLVFAVYVTERAMECESKLVRAIKIALTISSSGHPNAPQWDAAKSEMLELLRQGIAINPHYRKLTPMAADEMASWGDWKNAIWIWESVFASRPNVVALAANISRGYSNLGQTEKSSEFRARAAALQPGSATVKSLEAVQFAKSGNHLDAARVLRELFETNSVDYELAYWAYLVGVRSRDWPLAIQALEMRIKKWPNEASDGWLKLGDIYRNSDMNDRETALECYRNAIKAAPEGMKGTIRAKIPASYLSALPEMVDG